MMMNIKATYRTLFVALAAAGCLLGAGCRQKQVEPDMADSVKLEYYDLGLERTPNDHRLLAARARVLFDLQRIKEAAYDINRAVELDPENLEYLMLKSDIAFANGSIEDSYRTLEAAERLDPQNIDVQLKLGEITFYSRDYDRSLKYLTNVTEREPNNRTALFMKGYIYKEKGDTAQAVTLLRRVTDKFPDYAPAFEELGILYSIRQNPLSAEYLGTAIQLDPNNTNALYALAMYHQDLGNYDAAESLYRQLLDINANSADAWHNLGWIELTHYSDYQRAIEYFDRALAIDPAHAEARVNRQVAQEAQK